MIEYCGGTEIGGAFLSGSLALPQAPSVFTTPTLGASIVLIEADGTLSPHLNGTSPLVVGSAVRAPLPKPCAGELALVPPLLGSSQRLLNKDHGKVYFEGMPRDPLCSGMPLRRHGDEVQRLPGGSYRALGRCDDTMNLGGVKVSWLSVISPFSQMVQH